MLIKPVWTFRLALRELDRIWYGNGWRSSGYRFQTGKPESGPRNLRSGIAPCACCISSLSCWTTRWGSSNRYFAKSISGSHRRWRYEDCIQQLKSEPPQKESLLIKFYSSALFGVGMIRCEMRYGSFFKYEIQQVIQNYLSWKFLWIQTGTLKKEQIKLRVYFAFNPFILPN